MQAAKSITTSTHIERTPRGVYAQHAKIQTDIQGWRGKLGVFREAVIASAA